MFGQAAGTRGSNWVCNWVSIVEVCKALEKMVGRA